MQSWFPSSFSEAISPASGGPINPSEPVPSETTSLLSNKNGYDNYSAPRSSMDPSAISYSGKNIALLAKSQGGGIEEGGSPSGNGDQADSHIAQALNKLSMKERDQAYHELHGVDQAIQETPEFIQQNLQEFHSQLYSIKDTHPKAKAFQMALQQAAYVLDPKMGLKFLRADSFNVSKAADRMIRFFDLKLFLFGADLLCHDITMEDLSNDDRNTLKAGFIQLLPVRDRAGRAILVLVPTFQSYKVAENMVSDVEGPSSIWTGNIIILCSIPSTSN
jgi:hypothetical protein